MASGAATAGSVALFLALALALNLLGFALTGTTACATCPTPTPHKPPPQPKPTPCPPPNIPTPSSHDKCPIDTLKLAACANVLGGLITIGIGEFPKQPCDCCTLIQGLLDLEAAVCLCTALKANMLGVNLNVPVNLSLLLNYCRKKAPKEFQCP